MKAISWTAILLLIITSCVDQDNFDYPVVLTGDVTNITDTGAVFSARISNRGIFPITESGFLWGLKSTIDGAIILKNSESPGEVFSLQTNYRPLPGKAYYIRAYVSTESSISYGRQVTFNSLPGQIDKGSWSVVRNDEYTPPDELIISAFIIGDTIYLCLSDNSLYGFDKTGKTFTKLLSDPVLSQGGRAFAYNDYGYIFSEKSIYRYDPSAGKLAKLSEGNLTHPVYWGAGFIINDDIYIGLGIYTGFNFSRDFWKYNITGNTWIQVSSFPGEDKQSPVSFSINNSGYVGGGWNNFRSMNDFWSYDPPTDTWKQKEVMPVSAGLGTALCSYGYAYAGKMLYEYDPVFNIWERMSDLLTTSILSGPIIVSDSNSIYMASVSGNDAPKNLIIYEFQK